METTHCIHTHAHVRTLALHMCHPDSFSLLHAHASCHILHIASANVNKKLRGDERSRVNESARQVDRDRARNWKITVKEEAERYRGNRNKYDESGGVCNIVLLLEHLIAMTIM